MPKLLCQCGYIHDQSSIPDLLYQCPRCSIILWQKPGSERYEEFQKVFSVIDQETIVKYKNDIQQAVDAFIQLGTELLQQLKNGTVSKDWEKFEHGDQCRFRNTVTGQVIEIPIFDITPFEEIDPCFFAEFVKTSKKFNTVAALLKNDSHDAAKMLEALGKF